MQKFCASVVLLVALCGVGCASKKPADCGCGHHAAAQKHEAGACSDCGDKKKDCSKGECQMGTGSK